MPNTFTFHDWVEVQHELQIAMPPTGRDPANLIGEERAEFIRWNILAAIDELMEALAEVRWKPWDREDLRGEVDVEAFKKELVDVLHFIANLAIVTGISGDELSEEYLRKVEVNKKRHEIGYDTRVKATTRELERTAQHEADTSFDLNRD